MKTALVTGGCGGIGAETVRLLCQNGYTVAIHYNSSKDKALRFSAELNSFGYKTMAVRADVSNSASVEVMIGEITATFGFIGVLVNNAGISQQKLFTDITDLDWKRMLDINLTGTFNCCRSVLPEMIRQKKGSIINISSMWGQVGASCEVHYSAAKAGVIGLTKALAKEVAPSGIRVNCVSPGAIQTNMLACFNDAELKSLCEEIPQGHIGSPLDVAKSVLFLASQESEYITGQVLCVNGGAVI